MKVLTRLSLLFCALGLIMYVPLVTHFLTIHLGDAVGHYSGIVTFAMGWASLGAGLAFSAGRYRRSHITNEIE